LKEAKVRFDARAWGTRAGKHDVRTYGPEAEKLVAEVYRYFQMAPESVRLEYAILLFRPN
jgi:hypothetical protein